MDQVNNVVNSLNGLLFSIYVVYALLATGVLFTIWTAFGQWRALTHGVAVIRGKYDESQDPGAISHFQALSTALSATVGLGNIGGVALAVALGGPGAVFWMWVIGVLGMALKMTEVTQSMLYRNTRDPENPHGGPMFVAKYGFARWGDGPMKWAGAIVFALVAAALGTLSFTIGGTVPFALGVVLLVAAAAFIAIAFAGGAVLGATIGGLFVVTAITASITGGNMFQAWNVANTTRDYFGVPQIVSGSILAVTVAIVIIGGIRVIGRVASVIVPVMCGVYMIAALWVLGNNLGDVPNMLGLIFKQGLGIDGADAGGAFLGGGFGYAVIWGVKRALFSSEAGWGSAPIAHSAAKTDEPVREGVVAGLEPFIDTLVVCTVTALVILSSGAYDRGPEAMFAGDDIRIVQGSDATTYTIETPNALPAKTDDARRIAGLEAGAEDYRERETVFVIVDVGTSDAPESGAYTLSEPGNDDSIKHYRAKVPGRIERDANGDLSVAWGSFESEVEPTLVDSGLYGDYAGSSLTAHAFDRVTPGLGKWLVTIAIWLFALSTIISWSYYGEQGIVYLFGDSKVALIGYKVIYCVLTVITTLPNLITTDAELDMWTTLGMGVMICVNIPLMWLFGRQAMKAYHDYFRRLRAGPMHDEIDPASGQSRTDGSAPLA